LTVQNLRFIRRGLRFVAAPWRSALAFSILTPSTQQFRWSESGKPKEPIMQVRTLIAASALFSALFAAAAAQAAPHNIVKLPRVVITGKSVPAAQQVVTLPRVVVVGMSTTTLQRQLLAAKAARSING